MKASPKFRVRGAVIGLTLISAASPSRADYTFTTLAGPTGTGATPIAIDGNVVAGNYADGTGIRGFTYANGVYTTLNFPSAISTYVTGIAGNTIVGNYFDGSRFHGYTESAGVYTTFDVPTAANTTTITGISGNTIVGYYQDASFNYHGFSSTNGVVTTMDNPHSGIQQYSAIGGTLPSAISGSTVIGSYTTLGDPHSFLYENGTFTDILDPAATGATFAQGIFGDTIVGFYDDAGGLKMNGFIETGGVFTTLDLGISIPFFPSSSVTAFPALFTSSGTQLYGISGSTIVGAFSDGSGGSIGFIATLVPEPASIALLAIPALLLLRRHRNLARSLGLPPQG
jgi:hypothetical protein